MEHLPYILQSLPPIGEYGEFNNIQFLDKQALSRMT